ncbi:MAG: Lrp/AsnC family transcriptional regulator [Halodesulfurarchaeum sp.]
MTYAYVAAQTVVGSSPDVLAAVRDIDEVAEAHVVAGEYDLIIELDTGSSDHLDYADSPVTMTVLSIVMDEIQAIDGVTSTKTYVVID